MNDVLFIGAGTKGAKKIGNNFQPYIVIQGKTCIEHIFEAVYGSKIARKIYMWGDKKKLERLLKDMMSKMIEKGFTVTIIDEKQTPFESFLFAYFEYISDRRLKQTVQSWKGIKDIDWDYLIEYAKEKGILEEQISTILSDTPLITSQEIDYMMSHRDEKLDVIFGRTFKGAFEEVLTHIDEKFADNLAVKNFYYYVIKKKEVGLIVNSFFAGKPLKLDKRLWEILINFFENRTIIKGRRFNFKKIKNNYNHIKNFLFSQTREKKGEYASIMKSNLFLLKAYRSIVKNLKSGREYRDLSILFSKIKDVTGLKIEYQISDCVGAAFDIDTPYEADYINRHYVTLTEKIRDLSCNPKQRSIG